MEDVLRSKGLYQITLGKEQEPIDDENKVKWANKNDKARELIEMSILMKKLMAQIMLEKSLKLCLVNTILFEPTR
jgi:hypothetical protein